VLRNAAKRSLNFLLAHETIKTLVKVNDDAWFWGRISGVVANFAVSQTFAIVVFDFVPGYAQKP